MFVFFVLWYHDDDPNEIPCTVTAVVRVGVQRLWPKSALLKRVSLSTLQA
jgi:hypothetical protein